MLRAADDDLLDRPARGPGSSSGSPAAGATTTRSASQTPSACSALIIRAWSPVQRTSRSDSEPVALMLSMIWIAHMTPARSRPRICSIARLRSARQRPNASEGDQVQAADRDTDDRQERVVGEHHGDVDDQGQQADRRGRQLAGDQSGHPRRARGPADDVAGESMLKKGHRQPQDVPQESERLDERQPDLQPGQVDLLETGRGQPHHAPSPPWPAAAA